MPFAFFVGGASKSSVDGGIAASNSSDACDTLSEGFGGSSVSRGDTICAAADGAQTSSV